MTTAVQPGGASGRRDRPPSGLADVIDTILDKGLVIDAYVRVSLVGIELLTIDARIVVASVDTYLRFAEAVNRLDISQDKEGAARAGRRPRGGRRQAQDQGRPGRGRGQAPRLWTPDDGERERAPRRRPAGGGLTWRAEHRRRRRPASTSTASSRLTSS